MKRQKYDRFVFLRPVNFGRYSGALIHDNYVVDTFTVDSLPEAKQFIKREFGPTPIMLHGEEVDFYHSGADYRHLGLTTTLPLPAGRVTLDVVVLEIEQETQVLRGMGRLMPFIEGMPLGVIPADHRADRRGENGRGGRLSRGWR